jgi:hypothetical protein
MNLWRGLVGCASLLFYETKPGWKEVECVVDGFVTPAAEGIVRPEAGAEEVLILNIRLDRIIFSLIPRLRRGAGAGGCTVLLFRLWLNRGEWIRGFANEISGFFVS